MDFKKDFEEIKKDIEQEKDDKLAADEQDKQQPTSVSAPVNENLPTTFENAKNKALAAFKPTYDKNKSIYENGKDLVRTLGLNEAIKDDKFINKVAEGAKKRN